MSSTHNMFSALRFEPLQKASRFLSQNCNTKNSTARQSADSDEEDPEILKVQDSIKGILDKKEWLLEPNQRIELPTLGNSDSTENLFPLFSLGGFVHQTDDAIQKDRQAASLDPKTGQMRRLSTNQEEELRQKGTITVPSVYIKNQTHVWKVAPWFFSGKETIQNSFLDGIGAGLDHVCVYTWTSGSNDPFLPSWPGTIQKGLLQPIQKLLFGVIPQLLSAPVRPRKYNNEQSMKCLVDAAEDGYVLYHLEEQGFSTLRMLGREEQQAGGGRENSALEPQHHYSYYRSYDDNIWDELEKVWESGPRYRPSKGYFFRLRDADKNVGMERSEVEKSLYVAAAFDEISARQSPLHARRQEEQRATEALNNSTVQELIDHFQNLAIKKGNPLFDAEVKRLQAPSIMLEIWKKDDAELEELLAAKEAEYKKKRPILSLSKAWLKRVMSRESAAIKSSLDGSRSKRILEKLSQQHDDRLDGPMEELRLRKKFQEKEAPTLRAILSRERISLKHTFHILELDPQKWKVDSSSGHVDRFEKVEVSLSQWGWRFRIMWYRFLRSFRNLAASSYHFFVNGPLSIRSLLSPRAYYAMKRPNISGGGMEDDPNSLTPTLTSRLQSFFGALQATRERFEAQPETGLIDKSIQRSLLRIKNAVSAVFGSALIVFFMVTGTIFCSALTGLALIASPLLAGIWTILATMFDLLFYDTSACTWAPVMKVLSSVLEFLLFGVLQGTLATCRYVIVHPVIGLVHFVWCATRALLRTLRDNLTGSILFRNAKVPVDDTYIAKRIHGPGIASETYYRLPLQAAKSCVELLLHQALVNAHIKLRQSELKEPFRLYKEFLDSVFFPFGFKALILSSHSPESVCAELCEKATSKIKFRPFQQQQQQQQHNLEAGFGGPWDEVAKKIRRAHPSVNAAINECLVRDEARIRENPGPSINEYDAMVFAALEDATVSFGPSISYDLMSIRTGYLLANLELRKNYRDNQVLQAASIPSHASGKFRLSEQEMQELWAFTLRRTEEYGERIKSELLEIANGSDFHVLEREVKKIELDFWYGDRVPEGVTTSSSRRLTVKASEVLSNLLGGDTMLVPLEEVDESLVIQPVFSEEGAHLVFWDHSVSRADLFSEYSV